VVKPYQSEGSKKQQVAEMFDNIAHRYDFLNHFLSLGIDKSWRRKAIHELKALRPRKILDIATGTGDLALAAMKLNPTEIVGIDISEEMLTFGRQKIEKAGAANIIRFEKGDSEQIHYPNGTFDAAMVAFGVRNFENLQKGLNEIARVLAPGAKVVILEFSQPQNPFIKVIYHFYFFRIVPFFGKLFSNDNRAYTYLPESVDAFPDKAQFLQHLANAGFTELKSRQLTFGIASIYSGKKTGHNIAGLPAFN
jgi:demethylmenaquinone methyltransferase/2-methoxy-6-polyprenyl-1,4-benzoquinol methylase